MTTIFNLIKQRQNELKQPVITPPKSPLQYKNVNIVEYYNYMNANRIKESQIKGRENYNKTYHNEYVESLLNPSADNLIKNKLIKKRMRELSSEFVETTDNKEVDQDNELELLFNQLTDKIESAIFDVTMMNDIHKILNIYQTRSFKFSKFLLEKYLNYLNDIKSVLEQEETQFIIQKKTKKDINVVQFLLTIIEKCQDINNKLLQSFDRGNNIKDRENILNSYNRDKNLKKINDTFLKTYKGILENKDKPLVIAEGKEEDVPDMGEMKVEEDTKDDETLLKEKEIEGKRDFIITKLRNCIKIINSKIQLLEQTIIEIEEKQNIEKEKYPAEVQKLIDEEPKKTVISSIDDSLKPYIKSYYKLDKTKKNIKEEIRQLQEVYLNKFERFITSNGSKPIEQFTPQIIKKINTTYDDIIKEGKQQEDELMQIQPPEIEYLIYEPDEDVPKIEHIIMEEPTVADGGVEETKEEPAQEVQDLLNKRELITKEIGKINFTIDNLKAYISSIEDEAEILSSNNTLKRLLEDQNIALNELRKIEEEIALKTAEEDAMKLIKTIPEIVSAPIKAPPKPPKQEKIKVEKPEGNLELEPVKEVKVVKNQSKFTSKKSTTILKSTGEQYYRYKKEFIADMVKVKDNNTEDFEQTKKGIDDLAEALGIKLTIKEFPVSFSAKEYVSKFYDTKLKHKYKTTTGEPVFY